MAERKDDFDLIVGLTSLGGGAEGPEAEVGSAQVTVLHPLARTGTVFRTQIRGSTDDIPGWF